MPNIVTKEEQELYETLQDLWDRTESVDDVFEELSGYINGIRSAQSQPVPEVGAMADALGDALRSKHAVFLARTKLEDLVRAMLATAPEQPQPGAAHDKEEK